MIEANQLRIGNWFSDLSGNQFQCLGVTDHRYEHDGIVWYDKELGFYLSLSECEPIEITEDWLLRFGFEKDDYWQWGHKQLFSGFQKQGDHYFLRVGDDKNEPEIKYVHQLQNLFFAITGHELAVNNVVDTSL